MSRTLEEKATRNGARTAVAGVVAFLLIAPTISEASYGEGAYYGQSYYQAYYQGYYQASYQTIFSTSTIEKESFSVRGVITKGSGTFVIDHPLDPLNKLLFHSFVEAPNVMNFYDGIITLNAAGEAVVRLPNYFMVLNKDFRYQLKPIGQPQPNLYVKTEVADNRFEIAGGAPNGRVSWQVTATRNDPYIAANPIIVEVPKGPEALVDVGEYLHEDAWPSPLVERVSSLIAGIREKVGL